MSILDWGLPSGNKFESGIDRGVLYLPSGEAKPWNGISSINENISNAEETIRYYDGKSYRSQVKLGEYSATITSFTYPEELDEFENVHAGLSLYSRKRNTQFNFSYRTLTDDGYKIHLVYNATAIPAGKSYGTTNDSATPTGISWDITTTNIKVPGAKPCSHFIVDTKLTYSWIVETLEDLLYGSVNTNAQFPTVEELIAIFEDGSILQVTDHGDGTFTVDGPDYAVRMLDSTTWEIEWSSVIPLGSDTYQISSL